MIEIPLRSDLTRFELQVLLDSVTYTLRIQWNDRMEAWFMDVLNQDADTLIVSGLRLVVGFPLDKYRADRAPPGMLVALDTTGQGQEAAFGELGKRVKLFYVDAAEL